MTAKMNLPKKFSMFMETRAATSRIVAVREAAHHFALGARRKTGEHSSLGASPISTPRFGTSVCIATDDFVIPQRISELAKNFPVTVVT